MRLGRLPQGLGHLARGPTHRLVWQWQWQQWEAQVAPPTAPGAEVKVVWMPVGDLCPLWQAQAPTLAALRRCGQVVLEMLGPLAQVRLASRWMQPLKLAPCWRGWHPVRLRLEVGRDGC